RSLNLNVIETVSFPDHHVFTEVNAGALLAKAKEKGALLVTTAKDAVRLKDRTGAAATLASQLYVLEIEMAFDDPSAPQGIIEAAIEKCRTRLLSSKSTA